MAVSAGLALMSTATVGLTTAAFIGGTFMTHFLVTTAMGAALNALTPKPSMPSGANRGYQVTQRGAAVDHQIIYGQTRVGGVVVYDTLTGDDNEYLHRVVAFAGHEIEEFTTFYLNDVAVTLDVNGNVTNDEFKIKDGDGNFEEYAIRIKTHLGSDTQAADADLVSEVTEWTTDHRLRGVAYAYFRFKYDPNVFDQGLPDISAVIKGKKVYDPRTATTAWSNNPALCLRDYLVSDYGLGETSANIDDTLVSTAANVCQYYNYPTLTGDPRFTLNGAFVVSSTPYDIINDLTTAMGGLLWYAQGEWRMKPAYYTTPVLDLDENDLRSSLSVSTRHSRRDNFNTVRGVYRGPETDYQPTDYAPVTDPAFITDDGGQESVVDLDLPFTDDFDIARRLALIFLERNRQQITIQGSFGLRAFECQVGDVIRLTNTRFGWANKEFEVISWSFGLEGEYDLQVHLTLRETSANVFDDISDGATLELDNTELADPRAGLTVTNVSVSDEGNVQQDGTFVGQARVSWTAATNAFLNHYEVQWKDVTLNTWLRTEIARDQTSVIIGPLETGTQYNIRVRAVSISGYRGTWVAATPYTHGGDSIAPSPVTGASVVGGPKNVTLDWTAPTTQVGGGNLYDLKGYNIYRNTTDSQPVSPIAFSGSDKYVDGGLAVNTTYYYWVTAVDFTGNESTAVAFGSVTTDEDFISQDTRIYTGIVYYQTLQATAPTTPTATGFNEATQAFSGLTAGWSTTQPFVDATSTTVKEWSSKYKVEYDINNDATITFTTPDGAFQITDDIESDNYIAGTSGWRIERDTGFAEFGSAVIRDTLSAGQIPTLAQSKIANLTADLSTLSSGVSTAQSTADSKIKTFNQSTTPTASSVGDLWYNTSNDFYYRWSGTSWVRTAIQADTVVAGWVYAGTVNATQINAGTINVDRLPGLSFVEINSGNSGGWLSNSVTSSPPSGVPAINGIDKLWNEDVSRSCSAGSNVVATLSVTLIHTDNDNSFTMYDPFFVLYGGGRVTYARLSYGGNSTTDFILSNRTVYTINSTIAVSSLSYSDTIRARVYYGQASHTDKAAVLGYNITLTEFTK